MRGMEAALICKSLNIKCLFLLSKKVLPTFQSNLLSMCKEIRIARDSTLLINLFSLKREGENVALWHLQEKPPGFAQKEAENVVMCQSTVPRALSPQSI